MPQKQYQYLSYHLVLQLFKALLIKFYVKIFKAPSSSSILGLNLSNSSYIPLSPPLKQGRVSLCPLYIIFTSTKILSQCFFSALKPQKNSFLKYQNIFDLGPPNTSKYSLLNLKGIDLSNSIPLPGELDMKNPKSMCMIYPFQLIIIFPLCLSFTYKK